MPPDTYTPVVGDPFAGAVQFQLTPVTGDPFMALTDYARELPNGPAQPAIGKPGGAPLDDFGFGPVSGAPQPAIPGLADVARDPSRPLAVRIPAAIGSSLADQGLGLAKSAWGAATLPGDVAKGLVDPSSPEAIRRSTDLAGMLTLPAATSAEVNPDVLGSMGGARGSSKKMLPLSDEGDVWFHGSGQAYDPQKAGPLYLTQDPNEAAAFARGAHLGGAGDTPQVHSFILKRAPVADINSPVMDALESGDVDQTVANLAARHVANPNGARYLDFDHPSNVGGDEFIARVAIDPQNTLQHLGSVPLARIAAENATANRGPQFSLTPVDHDPFAIPAATPPPRQVVQPYLSPAVRVGGKVYQGSTHLDALAKVPPDQRANATLDGSNRGWMNDRGRFLNREKAQTYAVSNDLIQEGAPAWVRTAPEAVSEWLKPPPPR